LEFYTDVLDLSYLMDQVENQNRFSKKFCKLNKAIGELVEDYDNSKEKILEDLRQSLADAKAGRVHDISELWNGIDV
jgi:hypothetical protein